MLDGRGHAAPVTAVPMLTCYPAEGAEESEARQTVAAIETNTLCTALGSPLERMRSGEHHVLLALCAEVETDAVVLTSSPWLPVLRGELRLFTSGLYLHTAAHGPHVLPFRIHLAAAGAVRLESGSQLGLVLLRQKPASHAYGPLALLPEAPGGTSVDPEMPPERELTLGVVVRPRSSLQRVLSETVWPMWRRLFEEVGVPCNEIAEVPTELEAAMSELQSSEAARLTPPKEQVVNWKKGQAPKQAPPPVPLLLY